MVAERDLVGAQFLGDAVDHAPAQAGAERAGGFALRNLLLDDRVGVLFDDVVFDAESGQIFRQYVGGKAGLFLVEIHRDQAKVDGRALVQHHQQRKQGVRILAAGEANQHRIALFDHVVIGNRLAGLTFQGFGQPLQGV